MNSKDLRIVFMGTPDFALGILDSLVQNRYNVVGIVTVADKPAGRGKLLTGSPVKDYAIKNNIKVLQPINLKSDDFIAQLTDLKPDIQIIVAFRMLPKVVWSLPKKGTFNLHASLLPAYRGAAPINWAIINGEVETGVTTFFIDEKIDTGEIILQHKVNISQDDTFFTLHDKLRETGSDLVIKTIDLIASEQVNTITQPEIAPSTAPKLHKENCKINWNLPCLSIYNFIRGLSPSPSAWTIFENDGVEGEFKIFSTHFLTEKHSHIIGTILTTKTEIKVAVKDGFIIIDELQLPTRKKMDAKSLLNGYKFSLNTRVK